MSDPQARQAAALAAIDRAIRRSGMGYPIGAEVPAETLEMVRVVAAGLEGRRRIIERHHPPVGWTSPPSYLGQYAALGAPECPHCSGYGDTPTEWPCDDWLDTAAGLPLEDTDHD